MNEVTFQHIQKRPRDTIITMSVNKRTKLKVICVGMKDTNSTKVHTHTHTASAK